MGEYANSSTEKEFEVYQRNNFKDEDDRLNNSINAIECSGQTIDRLRGNGNPIIVSFSKFNRLLDTKVKLRLIKPKSLIFEIVDETNPQRGEYFMCPRSILKCSFDSDNNIHLWIPSWAKLKIAYKPFKKQR